MKSIAYPPSINNPSLLQENNEPPYSFIDFSKVSIPLRIRTGSHYVKPMAGGPNAQVPD